MVSGGKDHIVPPAINRSNYQKYRQGSARTDFMEFPGRGHWIIAEEGWEEVASFICDWLKEVE
jgi:dipeptidyl aminopeptidase/acylaminoacyl peptidase